VSIPVIVVGAVLVSGLFALAAHHTFYAVILYSLVVGLAGGVLGWALVDEFDRQATVLAGVAGVAFAGGIYLLYRYFAYRLSIADLAPRPGWWEHTSDQAAKGAVLSRRPGSSGVRVGETVMWGLWTLELTIAATVGALLGRRLDI
jgi:hypothetical protein